MSETSSDAESSCGWTIITNEGSDIETLGLEAVVDYGTELLERPPVEEAELQDTHASALAECVEEGETLDETLGDQTIVETLFSTEDKDEAAGKEHVSLLSASDHSDIMTLGDVREDEHADEEEEDEEEDEAADSEELYLGSSCSSQYAFTAAETVFPAQQQAATSNSSSEDETGPSSSAVVRRRRMRRNTTSTGTELQEETPESGLLQDLDREEVREEVREEDDREEDDREEKQQETTVRPSHDVGMRGRCRSVLHTCLMLTLVVAVCMSFSRLYGSEQIPRSPEVFVCGGSDLDPEEPFIHQALRDDLGPKDAEVISLLTATIKEIKKEKQEIKAKQADIQAQRDDFELLLQQKANERRSMEAEQQRLIAENHQLKNSLEHEEESLFTVQEELRNLHSKITHLEMMAAAADSDRSENQRLKEQLEEEKQMIMDVHVQSEELMAEAQTLKKELEEERKVTDELTSELNDLRSDLHGREVGSEAEELQSRVTELEKRLSFEKQRSDLWEKLYVENKEERAKGDTQSKVKKPKKGVAGKVQETFDAVKNSTKEFVHHHKEQIKKAKEAVKENLRKFSDTVKSTFRHFKDSASTLIKKARGFCHGKCDGKESWQHRSHKPDHRHKHDESFHSSRNTRKSGQKVHEDGGPDVKGCSGVFDCAYHESMSLFNRAMEPIRADEFYQLLQSYVHQEVDHFHHWKELESFINSFFHNGLFIHDQMLFTDFVRGVEVYLADLHEYQGLHDDMFADLDDYVYRHFFGEAYTKHQRSRGPFEKPVADSKDESRSKHHQRRQQRARSRPHTERKWSRSGGNSERQMADVKIELGPLPFDRKY